MAEQVQDIPLKEIFVDDEFNHRGYIAPIDIVDFANALKRDGLRTPVTVRPYNNPSKPQFKYTVVSGHRRTKAFLINKAETIPAFVRMYANELDAKFESLIENLHRKDLNIKQEADALEPFLNQGWLPKEIAQKLGQSLGWVDIRLKLRTLEPRVQEYAAAGLLKQEHIRHLYGRTATYQLEYVREVKEHVERGEKLEVKKPIKVHHPLAKVVRKRDEILEMITKLYDIFEGIDLWAGALSWAAGEISDYEMMKRVEEKCVELGLEYRVPNDMKLATMS